MRDPALGSADDDRMRVRGDAGSNALRPARHQVSTVSDRMRDSWLRESFSDRRDGLGLAISGLQGRHGYSTYLTLTDRLASADSDRQGSTSNLTRFDAVREHRARITVVASEITVVKTVETGRFCRWSVPGSNR